MPIHLGKTPSREGWLGFETDEFLTRTKARLKSHCLPCMTGLYEALGEGATQIELTHAWECWKITLVLETVEQCLAVLQEFQDRHPEEYVHGKYGGGVGRPTNAVIFHTESAKRRDEIAALLGPIAQSLFPGREVIVSRGCANPYEKLLGPWQEWKRISPIKNPQLVAEVRASLRDSLYKR